MSGKILIVDDERAIRTAVRDSLRREGYLAVTACSAEEAVRRCRSEVFDLLITDLKMPGMNGLELIREARVILPDIRSIIMTAYASTDSAVEALRLGVSDYIVKPFRLAELRSAAARLMQEAKGGTRRDNGVGAGREQEFEYRFGSGDDGVMVRGKAIGCGEEESRATSDAVRMAARALALYAKKTGRAIDPSNVAEAISDMLYFERRAPVNLRCEGSPGGRRVSAAIEAGASVQSPFCSMAGPSAGSFPGLRATVSTENAPPGEAETKSSVLADSKAEFVAGEEPSQTVSLDCDKVDLKYLVEQVESAARAAGLDAMRTNDIVAAVNEAVLNSIEHGYGRRGVGRVEVGWRVFAGEIVATVKDYGEGFDPDAVTEGEGFAAFRRLADRAAVESAPGRGTVVYLAKAAR